MTGERRSNGLPKRQRGGAKAGAELLRRRR